ncbi:hypothetical protein KAR91_50385 [Candidatus Pacearchaeota archaeon]|nr:hypothetical protein [Candidatus Pacearchaeota archaeon]
MSHSEEGLSVNTKAESGPCDRCGGVVAGEVMWTDYDDTVSGGRLELDGLCLCRACFSRVLKAIGDCS